MPISSKPIACIPSCQHRLCSTFHPFISHEAATVTLKQPRGKLPDDVKNIKFGTQFSDHMLTITWKQGLGFSPPQITPFQNISIHPASPALHYAVQAFEGTKVFRCSDGIRAFRMDKNLERFSRSMQRTGLPSLSPEDREGLTKLIHQLVTIDKDFVPDIPGYSLYLRPVAIGTQATLGLTPPTEFQILVFSSAVGPYYPSGFKPVKLLAPTNALRAFRGSAGSYKVGSNYGPTIEPFAQAMQEGFDQILWLYPEDGDFVLTEAGTMNVFVFWISETTGKPELVTPPLNDLILPGVTRDSILSLGREGLIDGLSSDQVVERTLYISEVRKALKEGRLLEMFGSGTAAIVCPISVIHYDSEDLVIPIGDGEAGDLCKQILQVVQSCQRGESASEMAREWSQVVCQ